MMNLAKLASTIMIAAAINLASLGAAQADLTSIKTKAIVTVYSDGKEIAKYEAIDEGQMDGPCFVFHIEKGVKEVQVRVCGTFIVEQI